MRQYSNRERPFHLGPLPLERLRRTASPVVVTGELPRDEHRAGEQGVAQVIPEYIRLFGEYLAGSAAKAAAPVPADPALRANNLKAHAYFLDAALVGCCQIEPGDWATVDNPGHRYACVFVVEFGREPGAGESGDLWIRGCNEARTDLRCAELAVVLSGYLRALGVAARGHFNGASLVDLNRLAVRAGVARPDERGRLQAPYLRRGFRVGVVTTEYELKPDLPLAQDGPLEPDDPDVRLGTGGTLPASRDRKSVV